MKGEVILEKKRCDWCLGNDIYLKYHDEEWGVAVHDDYKWFEFLVLESAQAGLSWLTILKRRENYRNAFAGFDPRKVAQFDENKIAELLQDEGIIRNRQKVHAAVNNARCFLVVQAKSGSFSNYMWQFVDGKPIQNKWKNLADLPAKTPLSEKITKEMKQLGFTFFGPTIAYAHMQATGMVNDHLVNCFRYKELSG